MALQSLVPAALAVVHGTSPIVLVAPHAGRRDPARRPWGAARLRMNDLHTGDVARELAARLDASALVNEATDRNDVDLARIGAAHEHAAHFLEALAALVGGAVRRHGRALVLTVHGWNVVQPAVDVGLGAAPADALVHGGGAVSPEFAATVLPALLDSLRARGVVGTPGLRYPARARENLLQLFTRRHRDDVRPLVRGLAALADRVDALQLELGLPLRLPGPWRDDFVASVADVLGRDGHPTRALDPSTWRHAGATDDVALEFVAPGLCGLAAIDAHGARLLLFPDGGRLFTFTGERLGGEAAHSVAGLRLEAADDGRVALAYDGPLLAFPDTAPFVDLEPGLARARVVRARIAVEHVPAHVGEDGPCPVGAVRGQARIGDEEHALDGHGVRTRRERHAVRTRGALSFPDGATLVARAPDAGILCRRGRHVALSEFRVEPLDAGGLRVAAVSVDGARHELIATPVHRLPVVFGGAPGGRLSFVACRTAAGLAGWVELPER